ncbi:bifunctional (p)ppGpp synthetase/guanosine-3',5'-bis(diphosphate) 3'-pyrophosphohydrolase [Ktedonosporobacter rubrisoli]|uniref:Bifunctional (P)ppGpp synthetase/guanosine-3',5'-bis(Diphosphate) 3'-pyrophosphohydrolase n=1 Tax=Ktedonosporobacter rubrisoli TaxID=2509675 RepID=A0A4P6K058_KTERU|nr:bifunctional (p)ppGpp synthetase/guanosine-3',5'-bis(diphosphate) 3'-pyrophosphohydrolase [Ktedonosporobacter rubrisoli]QBD81152.1 bifunctional (p)ppGpp synthetase/guanosine-3',5'-bis(diphosphate) 3'-pyrophosphohydrolase [Ktedonosporobacter rubrisoli]
MATNSDKVMNESTSVAQTMRKRDFPLSRMTLEDLLKETQQYLTPHDMERIKSAYDLANQAHKGAVRRSGEPYIQHPLEVALLLAGMRIDADGIMAALLHDVVEDTDYSLEDLSEQFGPGVANIVDGVTKFDALAGKQAPNEKDKAAETPAEAEPAPPPSLVDKRRLRSETVRKMLLAMAEDPRVVVLKLADRLHNMRTLSAMSPTQQQNTARETSEIYSPLARRLGMAIVQAELEDLAFSYLEPEKYLRLAREVEEEVRKRQPYIERVCQSLNEEMKRAGIRAEVCAWQKHLASINRKLMSSGEIGQIHDLISFRILVDTDNECYLALGHIHALWRPKDGRIKDFIANPKLNGYQSLHTTVFGLDNRLAEIQIRTHDMQRTADYGLASYWYLKERVGKEASPNSWRLSYREMVAWIEQLREWQRELPQSADEFVEAVKGDIFQEQIFVFTPKGEVKDLPRGSTPLDMAYRIHTDIGDHCAGARIITNMDDSGHLVTRLVPLDYELKGGEIVDIVTNRTVHPTRDWLSFARTAAARNKIRRYLKTYEREINLQLGRERLDLALKASGTAGINERIDELLQQIRAENSSASATLKKYATLDDIYVALGREDLYVENVLEYLLPLLRAQSEQAQEGEECSDGLNGHYHLGEGEVSGRSLVKLARCCCPIPGDSIVGVLHPSKGMYVHRSDCRVLRRYRDQTPGALVELNWLQIEPEYYMAPVNIVAHDRSGLLRDVAAVVADAGINMTAVTSTTNASLQKAVITATLEIPAVEGVLDQIERILRRLRQVKNVVSVERALSSK